jgi:serine protease AprX
MSDSPNGRAMGGQGILDRRGGTSMPKEKVSNPISREIVEYVLLGPEDNRRQLQDSPILGDVWTAFAANPGKLQDLLITPFGSQPAGIVARAVATRIPKLGMAHDTPDTYANIAYLQGLVAARLYFEELLRVILPLTKWWQDKIKDEAFTQALDFEAMIARTVPPPPPRSKAETTWYRGRWRSCHSTR